jgi:hypothetical protein
LSKHFFSSFLLHYYFCFIGFFKQFCYLFSQSLTSFAYRLPIKFVTNKPSNDVALRSRCINAKATTESCFFRLGASHANK